MMAQHEKSNMIAYRVWESEQQAREERCQRYEKEREQKELLREEEEDAHMEEGNVSLYKIDSVSGCPTRLDIDIRRNHPVIYVVKLLSP